MTVRVHRRPSSRRRGLALLAAALVVSACGSSTPTPAPGEATAPVSSAEPSAVAGETPGGMTPGAAATPAAPEVPSSSSLIGAAEQAGTIDHDTALLYQLYSALAYGSLPSAYRSDNPAVPDATTILAELRLRFAQLSPDLQNRVAPFFKRPSDPESIWQKRLAAGRSDAGSVVTAAFTAAAIDYRYVDAEATPVRVWYAAPLGEEDQRLAIQLADEIDRSQMWAKEQRAMLGHTPCSDEHLGDPRNGGDGRLDIYLVYPGVGLDWNGRTATLPRDETGTPTGGVTIDDDFGRDCPYATFIALNAARSFDHLKSTTAHELFHAFQLSFRNSEEPDRAWWSEASATWATDLIYPELDFEQWFLNGFWSHARGAEGPLDRFVYAAGPQYAAYIWPFYLRQYASGNEEVVGRLWQASETLAPIQVMGKLNGWADRFKEFALWNWNREPLIKYRDGGEAIAPEMLGQNTMCMRVDCILTLGTYNLYLGELGPASVEYLEGKPEVDVGELRFDLGSVQGKPGVGLQAIVSIGDSPGEVKVEDWSNRAERRFCLDSEDVRKIVLVVTNSSVDPASKLSGSIPIEASPGCPAITRASATYTKDSTGVGVHAWSRLSMVVVSSGGRTTATVDYQWDKVETLTSTTRRESVRGSGTVDAWIGCSINEDGSVGVETSWTDLVPATRTSYSGDAEASFLEFQGFMFTARDDPNKKRISGSRTEDDSSADGVDVAVYTWDCPNPTR